MLQIKQIKKVIEDRGLDFDTWRKNTVANTFVKLLDKDKEYYPVWELDVLNNALFDLLVESSKQGGQKATVNHHKTIQNNQENQKVNK